MTEVKFIILGLILLPLILGVPPPGVGATFRAGRRHGRGWGRSDL